MAMNGDTLGTAIKNALAAFGIAAEDEAAVEAVWQAVAGAIVTHISTNAVVAAGITCAVDAGTHNGATTGPGTIS